jgi:hypothetical protein
VLQRRGAAQHSTTRYNAAATGPVCGAAAAGAKGVADVLRRLRRLKALHVGGNVLGGSDGLQFSGALQLRYNSHAPLQRARAATTFTGR